jgi:aspartyl-tRNA(Asn)/glutamyl-tRNA(Gln) amidotransferase subunit A
LDDVTDFSQLRKHITAGELCCKEITQTFLESIDKGAHLNAFIIVRADEALQQAQHIDEKLQRGQAGKLAGLVLAIKDNLALSGWPMTCGSKILGSFTPPYTATVLQRLLAEDAVIIGKTNMDEFAMGSSTENSAFGPVRNPHDPGRVAGGSSGGSAAVVAANLCSAALGSDTGGSIRQPAAFCGVVGLKPTYGRVSRYGLVAYASSLDQIGPITRSVADSALLLEVMAGHDDRDATSSTLAVDPYTLSLGRSLRGVRVGIPIEYAQDGVQAEIGEALQAAQQQLQAAGAEIKTVHLSHTAYAVAAYYVIATAEASSNLARYDGAHYGYRSPNRRGLEEQYVYSRHEGFGAEVQRRIMLGTFVLSSGYYDAYYRKAQQVRNLIKKDFTDAFDQVDCLLTPTTPTTAFAIGEKIDDPLTMYLSDIFTVSANLAGLPALSLPFGKDAAGLPIGLQLIGRPFDEKTLFPIADYLYHP